MTSAFAWQNSISLCPASFRTPRPNLPVTPDVSWLPTFAFQSTIMKRTSFWGVSSKVLVGLHRTVQLQFLQRYWLGHRLGLPWYWMVCLGNEQRSFCHFWDCIQVLHFGLFCWLWWLLHSSKGFLPTVINIMVISSSYFWVVELWAILFSNNGHIYFYTCNFYNWEKGKDLMVFIINTNLGKCPCFNTYF